MAAVQQQALLLEAGQGLHEDESNPSAGEEMFEKTRHRATMWTSVRRPIGFVMVGCVFFAAVRHWSMQRAVPIGAPQHIVELSSKEQGNEDCESVFEQILAGALGEGAEINLGHYDFTTGDLKELPSQTSKEAADQLEDAQTNVAMIGKCSREKKSIVWFYPDTSVDHDGGEKAAFLIGSGGCVRMASMLDEDIGAACITVYRIPELHHITNALESFHDAGTIVHAVIGGHGADSTSAEDGFLMLSDDAKEGTKDISAQSEDLPKMLATLRERLAPLATIFMDSSFAGINGVAKAVSAGIPEAWVFGGVVSLTPDITVNKAPFSGGSDGPVRIVSERTQNDTIVGEPLLAFHEGKNMGSVTQWMYTSANNKVIRAGCRVMAKEALDTVNIESGTEDMSLSDQQIMPGMNGTVAYMLNEGKVVNSGNALIIFDQPGGYKTNDGGASTGALLVQSVDFEKLDVTEEPNDNLTAACAPGYVYSDGDVEGQGMINSKGGAQKVAKCQECADLCSSESTCMAYECSIVELQCNLNTQLEPNADKWQFWNLCQKQADEQPMGAPDSGAVAPEEAAEVASQPAAEPVQQPVGAPDIGAVAPEAAAEVASQPGAEQVQQPMGAPDSGAVAPETAAEVASQPAAEPVQQPTGSPDWFGRG